MSKAFDEAFKLVKQTPIQKDIIDQLDELKKDIDPSEERDFAWLYEAANLEVNDTSND